MAQQNTSKAVKQTGRMPSANPASVTGPTTAQKFAQFLKRVLPKGK